MQAIFLDRDGVICENRSDYVKSWREFKFLPGAKQSLAALRYLGLPIIVVTNQSAIGRGIIPAEVVEEIHRQMVTEIQAYGGHITRIYYCPHHPEAGCDCRKPQPGMLLQAAQELGIDLNQSYMVGDAVTDLVAGQQAYCHSILVLTGRGLPQLTAALGSMHKQFTITRNLMQAAGYIYKRERQKMHGRRPSSFDKPLPQEFRLLADRL
ncbi:MAG: D-glycero-beta-D-manno-heptose 1,7-bisphosphate 7-phosphatase [Anaerolineales bacterium]|nr:D-glycero-beta-D-manno-heptose 1,7-bisphosphate 7-phosphatase [Anaerolineales bacterium]